MKNCSACGSNIVDNNDYLALKRKLSRINIIVAEINNVHNVKTLRQAKALLRKEFQDKSFLI